MYVHDRNEFDLVDLEILKMPEIKIGISRSVYEIFMSGSNCRLQFDRRMTCWYLS